MFWATRRVAKDVNSWCLRGQWHLWAVALVGSKMDWSQCSPAALVGHESWIGPNRIDSSLR
jgi:hypothetical protein